MFWCPFAQLRAPAKSDRFTKRPQKMGADCFSIAGNLLPFQNSRSSAICETIFTQVTFFDIEEEFL